MKTCGNEGCINYDALAGNNCVRHEMADLCRDYIAANPKGPDVPEQKCRHRRYDHKVNMYKCGVLGGWVFCDIPLKDSHTCLFSEANIHDVTVTAYAADQDSKIKVGKDQDCGATEVKRGDCLFRALEVINGERQDQYGNPEDSFELVGRYWTVYLRSVGIVKDDPDIELDKREVAEMMALFKIARMSGQMLNKDNYIDAAGYIGIAGDMVP